MINNERYIYFYRVAAYDDYVHRERGQWGDVATSINTQDSPFGQESRAFFLPSSSPLQSIFTALVAYNRFKSWMRRDHLLFQRKVSLGLPKWLNMTDLPVMMDEVMAEPFILSSRSTTFICFCNTSLQEKSTTCSYILLVVPLFTLEQADTLNVKQLQSLQPSGHCSRRFCRHKQENCNWPFL